MLWLVAKKIASLISGQIKEERATPCRKIFNWGGGGLWKTGSQAWTGCNNLHMYEPALMNNATHVCIQLAPSVNTTILICSNISSFLYNFDILLPIKTVPVRPLHKFSQLTCDCAQYTSVKFTFLDKMILNVKVIKKTGMIA